MLKMFVFVLIVEIIRVTQSKECYSCEGINCLRASRVSNKATCLEPLDNCVTVFEKFTTVARGCYSSLPEEYRSKCDDFSDSHCHKCNSNLCNDKGAISCIQCSSEQNTNCSSAMSVLQPSRCPVSTSVVSYCFTRKSFNKIERGCLIDTKQQLNCLDDSSCEMCIADGEDTCNHEYADLLQSSSKRVSASSVFLLTYWLTLASFELY